MENKNNDFYLSAENLKSLIENNTNQIVQDIIDHVKFNRDLLKNYGNADLTLYDFPESFNKADFDIKNNVANKIKELGGWKSVKYYSGDNYKSDARMEFYFPEKL